jgi:hypothetical protein
MLKIFFITLTSPLASPSVVAFAISCVKTKLLIAISLVGEFDLMERIHSTLRTVELACLIPVAALGALRMCALLFPVASISERCPRTGSRVPFPGTVAFSFRKPLDKILKHKEEHEFLECIAEKREGQELFAKALDEDLAIRETLM